MNKYFMYVGFALLFALMMYNAACSSSNRKTETKTPEAQAAPAQIPPVAEAAPAQPPSPSHLGASSSGMGR